MTEDPRIAAGMEADRAVVVSSPQFTDMELRVRRIVAVFDAIRRVEAEQRDRVHVSEGSGAFRDENGLHPRTAELVRRFAEALAGKLRKAEEKYGYSDGWLRDDWQNECQAKLAEHVQKGDPLDVSAYAAFCWRHGWSTASPPPPPAPAGEVTEEEIQRARDLWIGQGADFRAVLTDFLSRRFRDDLDRAWRAVNDCRLVPYAEGTFNDYGKGLYIGHSRGIDNALRAIEALGGKGPGG